MAFILLCLISLPIYHLSHFIVDKISLKSEDSFTNRIELLNLVAWFTHQSRYCKLVLGAVSNNEMVDPMESSILVLLCSMQSSTLASKLFSTDAFMLTKILDEVDFNWNTQ